MAISNYFIYLNSKSDSLVNVKYELIEDDYIRTTLKHKIEREQREKTTLLNLKANTAISDSLFSKYKGSVVYVDIWSTSCGACLREMKWSMELQKEYSGKPIIFLYLCIQSREKDWQRVIKEREIEGEHVLLSDKQFHVLSALFNFGGIPHYLLINKDGEILNNALSPSDKRINQRIDAFLDE